MNPILIINPNNINEHDTINFKIRLSARGVVYDEDKNIALLPVSAHSYYELPGGGIDEGESEIVAFRRECLEEIGWDVEVIKELGSIVEYRSKSSVLQTSYCYVGKRIGKKQQTILTEFEIKNGYKDAIWVSLDKAIELLENNINSESGKFIVERDTFILKSVRSLGILS